MKHNEYEGWIEQDNKFIRNLGTYYALTLAEAKILAKADAIKAGLDYNLVKVEEIKSS